MQSAYKRILLGTVPAACVAMASPAAGQEAETGNAQCYPKAMADTDEYKPSLAQKRRERLVEIKNYISKLITDNSAGDTSKLQAQLAFVELAIAESDPYFVKHAELEAAVDKCVKLVQKEKTLIGAKSFVEDGAQAAFAKRIETASAEKKKSITEVEELAKAVKKLAPKEVASNPSLTTIALSMKIEEPQNTGDTGKDKTSLATANDKPENTAIASRRLSEAKYKNARWLPNEVWAGAIKNYVEPPNTLTVAQYSLPGSVLDKRGITSTIAASNSGTNVSLGFSDTIRFRGLPKCDDPEFNCDEFYQEFRTFGYSLKLTTGKNGNIFTSKDTKDENPAERSIDRIAGDTKIAGSISWNIYGRENKNQFDIKEQKMQKLARAACLKEQVAGVKYPSSCRGVDLAEWIFARDLSTGGYAHPKMVDAWNAVYWGPPEGRPNAKYGMGLHGEIGWKDFTFTPIGADESETKDKFNYSVAPYFYYAPTDKSVVIYKLTYKDEWEQEKKGEIPTKDGRFIPSLEGRYLFSGSNIGRYSFPKLGLSPKISFDSEDDRWSAESKFYFVGKDDKLTGGFNVAHNWGGEEEDEWGFGLFLGTTFTLDAIE